MTELFALKWSTKDLQLVEAKVENMKRIDAIDLRRADKTGKLSRVHCTVYVENYARVHRIDEL